MNPKQENTNIHYSKNAESQKTKRKILNQQEKICTLRCSGNRLPQGPRTQNKLKNLRYSHLK